MLASLHTASLYYMRRLSHKNSKTDPCKLTDIQLPASIDPKESETQLTTFGIYAVVQDFPVLAVQNDRHWLNFIKINLLN